VQAKQSAGQSKVQGKAKCRAKTDDLIPASAFDLVAVSSDFNCYCRILAPSMCFVSTNQKLGFKAQLIARSDLLARNSSSPTHFGKVPTSSDRGVCSLRQMTTPTYEVLGRMLLSRQTRVKPTFHAA